MLKHSKSLHLISEMEYADELYTYNQITPATQKITGVTVVYNTQQLGKKSYECIRYLDYLEKRDIYLKIINTGYNIGHGRGINLGIKSVSTPIILLFDSDIE